MSSRVFIELPADERSRNVREKLSAIAKERGIDQKLLILFELEAAVETMENDPTAGAQVARGGAA